MSLIISTGSNLGDKLSNLEAAEKSLSQYFEFIAKSQVFLSPAIEYLQQPDFYNQALEFKIPAQGPAQVMNLLLSLEAEMGRNRSIPKGPRPIDIDIIFWGTESFHLPNLTVPHPAWQQRSFVVYPIMQLPYFQTLKNHFIIPSVFDNIAEALTL